MHDALMVALACLGCSLFVAGLSVKIVQAKHERRVDRLVADLEQWSKAHDTAKLAAERHKRRASYCFGLLTKARAQNDELSRRLGAIELQRDEAREHGKALTEERKQLEIEVARLESELAQQKEVSAGAGNLDVCKTALAHCQEMNGKYADRIASLTKSLDGWNGWFRTVNKTIERTNTIKSSIGRELTILADILTGCPFNKEG